MKVEFVNELPKDRQANPIIQNFLEFVQNSGLDYNSFLKVELHEHEVEPIRQSLMHGKLLDNGFVGRVRSFTDRFGTRYFAYVQKRTTKDYKNNINDTIQNNTIKGIKMGRTINQNRIKIIDIAKVPSKVVAKAQKNNRVSVMTLVKKLPKGKAIVVKYSNTIKASRMGSYYKSKGYFAKQQKYGTKGRTKLYIWK